MKVPLAFSPSLLVLLYSPTKDKWQRRSKGHSIKYSKAKNQQAFSLTQNTRRGHSTTSEGFSQREGLERGERTCNTMRKNLPKTLDQLIFCYYLVNVLKFTKYLVNVPKFTKYLVNSYHQKGVKHCVLINWYQMTSI